MNILPQQESADRTPAHPTSLEQSFAVAIVLWIMLAGVLVVVANAWAAGML